MTMTPVTPELPQVLMDVTMRRQKQIGLGWTPEHDDTHTLRSMLDLTDRYANAAVNHATDASEQREWMVDAVALMVAAVESLDRKARR